MDFRITPASDPRWCSVRIYLEGESQFASGLSIVDHAMHVGSITLRMAGVAGVSTREEHRMKGYSRKVITRAIEHMGEAGYDVSMLFGIRNFYPKFGYSATPFDYQVELDTESALQAPVTFQARPLEDRDLRLVLSMYERHNANRSGSVVRRREWPGFSKGSDFRQKPLPSVLIDPRDEPVGYFVLDDNPERTVVSEMGATHSAVWDSLLHAIAGRAHEYGHEHFRLLVPPDHPAALACKRYGCQIRLGYPADGGGMMRIINLGTTFQKLLPELSRRWQQAGSSWQGSVQFQTDIGCIDLQIGPTGVALHQVDRPEHPIRLPQHRLVQMIIGHRSPSEIQCDPGVDLPDALLDWLDILFPAGYPYVWWSDRF